MLEAKAYFDRVSDQLPGDAEARATALAAAEAAGLPTRRQEAWHYTDVARLLKNPDSAAALPVDFGSLDPLMMTFTNGRAEALPEATGLTLAPFETDAEMAEGAVLNYNAALAQDGLRAEVSGALTQALVVTTAGDAPTHLHHK
ncbi:MAG: hypothetical protein ISQ19_05745, partial [PS1 clade bacterium]|nr:hypothetical protein [PS1 clade bacterium]